MSPRPNAGEIDPSADGLELTGIAVAGVTAAYSTLLFLLTDNQEVMLFTNLTESKLSHVKALAGF